MKTNKNLKKELKKYNISFEIVDGIYYLFGGYQFPYSEKECWDLVNAHRNSRSSWKTFMKKVSSKKERMALAKNIKNENYDNALIREGKADPWCYD